MAKIIKLADLSAEPTKVEIFEHTYELKQITRTVQAKLEVAQAKLEASSDDGDSIVANMAETLAILLSPNGSDAPPVKKVLVDAWKADKLSLAQINGLFTSLQEDAATAARPT